MIFTTQARVQVHGTRIDLADRTVAKCQCPVLLLQPGASQPYELPTSPE